MNYAVIKSGGKQYKVASGDVIEVDRIPETKDKKIVFDKVLLLNIDGKVRLGKPYLEKTEVIGKILEQTKGDKIRVAKFKSKVRYRRAVGFRAKLTKVEIAEISQK